MAKKNRKDRKNQDAALPEGMSRRQAKLAARAAERAALQKDPRPFAGLTMEADLVAMQEFIPAATAQITVDGVDVPVTIATVLPGASAAVRREDEALVGLQVVQHSHNPGRDLAYALAWLCQAAPGESLASTIADGTQPALTELIDASLTLDIEVHDDFNWWFPEGTQLPPDAASTIQTANATIVHTRAVPAEVSGSPWFANPGGGKAYLRWVRVEENENALLNALARLAARGELNLAEDTKFAGVFRTHGLVVPVWDLPEDAEAEDYAREIERVDAAIIVEVGNDAQLSADERKQLQNIKSRQVTIR